MQTFLTDESFLSTMNNAEKDDIIKFLGNTKGPGYKNIVEKMLRKFKILECSMSIKICFLHMDFFPENLGAVSELDESVHQGIKETEKRYKGW